MNGGMKKNSFYFFCPKTQSHLLRSYIELKVMVPCDMFVVCTVEDLSCVPEPDDDDPCGSLLELLRPISSVSRPGFESFSSSTSNSPFSIFTMVDMAGRAFGITWVHTSPIFRYLQASSVLESPSSNSSTNWTSIPFLYRVHAWKNGLDSSFIKRYKTEAKS